MRENELNTIISYITNILNINTQDITKDLLTIYKSTNEEIDTIKRGYDSKSTKRYSITYQVNYTSYL